MSQKYVIDPTQVYIKNRQAWHKWLAENHDKVSNIWLIFDKGSTRTLSYEDIVQEALCFGWIDSTAGRVSETQSKIYMCRRKPGSNWSQPNKMRVEKLIGQGLMKPAGLEAIKVAKENGSWDALAKSDNLELPPELITLFGQNPTAKFNFENFSPSSKRTILAWIYTAKRNETRQKRIKQTVKQAAKNLKPY